MIYPWTKIEGQGVNWQKMMVEMNANVKTYGDQITDIKSSQKEHAEKQDKDFAGLREHICKKIDGIVCPRNGEIDVIITGQGKGKERYGELKDTVEEHIKVVTDMMKEEEAVRKIKKALWVKVGKILGLTFSGMTAIAAFVTWLMGLWSLGE